MPTFSKSKLLGKLEELGISLDKRRGQCYLIDHNIINSIIRFAELNPSVDTVLEIGAGLGILSDALIENSKQAFLIENDRKIGKYLAQYYSDLHPTVVLDPGENDPRIPENSIVGKRVILLRSDALKISFPKVSKIVANIPYQISAPLIFKIIEEWNYERVILMVQKEFARRLVGQVNTKNYSRLSAAVGLFLNIKPLKDVPPTCFYPQPRVVSTIIEIRKKSELDSQDMDLKEQWRKSYLALLRGVFPYKNRTLRNALKIYFKNEPHAGEKMQRLNLALKNPESDPPLQIFLNQKIRSIDPDRFFYLMLYGLTGEQKYITKIHAADFNER